MATFDRVILPRHSSTPVLPAPSMAMSHSGKLNSRSISRIGWSWEEQLFFKWNTANRKYVAHMVYWFHRGTTLDVVHQDLTLMGAGGGTPLVAGADQTGGTIDTDGWPLSTNNILRAGDFVQFAGSDIAYMIQDDVSSDGSGDATLAIAPHISAGNSPADNAAVTITDSVVFKAKIVSLDIPSFGADMFVVAHVGWQEVV